MYFISILAIILVTVITSYSISIYVFMDIPSLLLVLLLNIPILISSGLLKDLHNAFRIVFGKKSGYSLIEIKRAAEAVNMTIRTLLCSGAFLFLISMVTMLGHLDDPSILGPYLSAALLCPIYACGMAILLLPIKSILQVRTIEFMPLQENAATEIPQEKNIQNE